MSKVFRRYNPIFLFLFLFLFILTKIRSLGISIARYIVVIDPVCGSFAGQHRNSVSSISSLFSVSLKFLLKFVHRQTQSVVEQNALLPAGSYFNGM